MRQSRVVVRLLDRGFRAGPGTGWQRHSDSGTIAQRSEGEPALPGAARTLIVQIQQKREVTAKPRIAFQD
jgi:hypothetical protein